MFNIRDIFTNKVPTIIAAFAIAAATSVSGAVVYASTSIGDNISTDGTLDVSGTSVFMSNVGIGVTSPNEKLTVNDGRIRITPKTDDGGSAQIYATGEGSGAMSISSNAYYDGSNWVRDDIAYGASNLHMINDGRLFYRTVSSGANPVTFTDRFVIDTGGNVGIGTTDPGEKLEVYSGVGAGRLRLTTDDGDGSIVQGYAAGDVGNLQFKVGADLTALRLNYNGSVVMNGGNVGIGTTTPGALLDIESSSALGTGLHLNHVGTGDFSQIQFQENGTVKGFVQHFGSTRSTPVERRNNFEIGTISTSSIQFRPNDAAAMTIVNGGNVGIGTTAPGAKLDVANGGIALMMGADNNATTRTNSTLKWGALTVPHYTNAEEPMATIVGVSDSSSNDVEIGGGSSLLNAATSIKFYTAANNTTVLGTEAMRITGGNVGIGTTGPNAKLQVADGDVYIETIGKGVILKSPDGTCARGTINNSNTLAFTDVACP